MDLYGLRADTNENLLVTKAVQNSHSYVQTYITGISFPREVRRSCLVELETKLHSKVCNHGEGPH